MIPSELPKSPDQPKRSRFAGERLGAWLFAASFSVGIWGLALKVLSPSHPAPAAVSAPHYALLAPSDAADGHATVVWGTEAAPSGYPAMDGAPVLTLAPPDDPAPSRD
jgi:hypothetical protein